MVFLWQNEMKVDGDPTMQAFGRPDFKAPPDAELGARRARVVQLAKYGDHLFARDTCVGI